jgi:hypothetical protein
LDFLNISIDPRQ